eukprot:826859-Pyramimonas_sp.AAC.1
MAATVHAACVDIDQAFESCSATGVGEMWMTFEREYLSKLLIDRVFVRRGRAFHVRHGQVAFGRGWWSISLSAIHRAVVAVT